MNNKDFENFFTTDNNSNTQFEDISSNTKNTESEGSYSLSSFSGKGNFKKHKRGIAKWWSSLKKSQKAILISAVSLVLVVVIAFGVLLSVFDYNYKKIETDDLGFENVIDKNIVNVALFGIDTRDTKSFEGHSDSIMILSLNTVTKKVKIISVMRDTLVPITYDGKTIYTKINFAYYKGGPELAIKTLNQLFGLDISEYATVNFYGMVDIIDAVGGIDAELTPQEIDVWGYENHRKVNWGINGTISEICGHLGVDAQKYLIKTAGSHHLNGIQAVGYSRVRKASNIWGTNNDYGRTDRQRYVMEQLFNKATTLEKSKYIELAKSLIPCSETSLSYTEIMGLAFDILLKNPTFKQARIPTEDYLMPSPNTSAGSVVYFDLDFAAKLINSFIYDDIAPDSYIESNGVEKNDWYRNRFGNSSYSSSSKPQSSDTPTESKPEKTDEPTESSVPSETEEPTESENPDTSSGSETTDTPSNENPTDTPEAPEESPTTPTDPEQPTQPTESEAPEGGDVGTDQTTDTD